MQAFDIQPSKTVGIIKDCIKDSILDGKIENNFEAAYNLMVEKGRELGFEVVNKSINNKAGE